jgi:hypothetical protein
MRSAEEPEAGGKGLTAASSPLRERLLRLRRSITEPLLQYFHDMHMVRELLGHRAGLRICIRIRMDPH